MKRFHIVRMATAAIMVFSIFIGTNCEPFCTELAAGQESKILNVTDAVELMQADMTAQKKTIIAHSMEMSEPESEVFWPLYNDYGVAKEKLDDRSIRLVKDFLQKQEMITDNQAKKFLSEFLSIEKERVALKEKYVEKFTRALPTRLVLKYFQLDNKMEAALRWALAEEIPLVK